MSFVACWPRRNAIATRGVGKPSPDPAPCFAVGQHSFSFLESGPEQAISRSSGVRWRVTISRRVNEAVQPTPNLQETVPIFYAIN